MARRFKLKFDEAGMLQHASADSGDEYPQGRGSATIEGAGPFNEIVVDLRRDDGNWYVKLDQCGDGWYRVPLRPGHRLKLWYGHETRRAYRAERLKPRGGPVIQDGDVIDCKSADVVALPADAIRCPPVRLFDGPSDHAHPLAATGGAPATTALRCCWVLLNGRWYCLPY